VRARASLVSMVSLGRTLVVLGVAVWPVWGVLALTGRAPHVLYAVAAHLALVLPGGMLLRAARPERRQPSPRQRLGTALIWFGVLAWLPYFALRELTDADVPSWPFLTWHLLGVIPGALLRYTRIGAGVLRSRP
jgi:peptidoglycan/LPS O-acetylase OafA/YrhL